MQTLTSNIDLIIVIFLVIGTVYSLEIVVRLFINRRKEDREEAALRKKRKDATTTKSPSHH